MSKDIWHEPNEEMKQVAGLAILVLENGDLNTMWMYPSQKCPEFVYGTEFVSPADKPIKVEKWCWAAELISTLLATRKALEIIKKEMSKETMPDFAVISDALKTALEQKEG